MAGTVHVHPAGDQANHDTDQADCVCGPTVQPVQSADVLIGWVIAHHSLAGHERTADGHQTVINTPRQASPSVMPDMGGLPVSP